MQYAQFVHQSQAMVNFPYKAHFSELTFSNTLPKEKFYARNHEIYKFGRCFPGHYAYGWFFFNTCGHNRSDMVEIQSKQRKITINWSLTILENFWAFFFAPKDLWDARVLRFTLYAPCTKSAKIVCSCRKVKNLGRNQQDWVRFECVQMKEFPSKRHTTTHFLHKKIMKRTLTQSYVYFLWIVENTSFAKIPNFENYKFWFNQMQKSWKINTFRYNNNCTNWHDQLSTWPFDNPIERGVIKVTLISTWSFINDSSIFIRKSVRKKIVWPIGQGKANVDIDPLRQYKCVCTNSANKSRSAWTNFWILDDIQSVPGRNFGHLKFQDLSVFIIF
jgi:hypothetical protein